MSESVGNPTTKARRFKQRPDHGDVIESPAGEFVLADDFDILGSRSAGLESALEEIAGFSDEPFSVNIANAAMLEYGSHKDE